MERVPVLSSLKEVCEDSGDNAMWCVERRMCPARAGGGNIQPPDGLKTMEDVESGAGSLYQN